MRILGITYTVGSAEMQKMLQEGISAVFQAAKKYQEDENDPEIEFWRESFNDNSDFGNVLAKIKNAQVVILAAPAHNLEKADGFVRKLSELDERAKRIGLRGKWAGLVVHGVSSPFQTEQYTNKIIGSCNRAGMLLLPNAVARSTHVDNEFIDHVTLGQNAAIALSATSEWKGRTVWQEEKAA